MRHEQTVGQSSSYARQVWLAGLGVLGTLQKESGRLFDEFVKEGKRIEHKHGQEGMGIASPPLSTIS